MSFTHTHTTDSQSSSEEKGSDEGDEEDEEGGEGEGVSVDEQLKREKAKAKKANQTIASLLQQVNQYKMVIEEEKVVLENELKQVHCCCYYCRYCRYLCCCSCCYCCWLSLFLRSFFFSFVFLILSLFLIFCY